MRLELTHCDTCLACYWAGHHKAHIQIPVWHGMKLKEIKESLKTELSQGCIMGNDDLAFLLSSDFVGPERDRDASKAFKAAIAAINRLSGNKKGQRTFFKDLEKNADEYDESVYAFFVFHEV